VVKAFMTENGVEMANAALQVLGGHGYIHENLIEQTVRDSRIAPIYEGTNEIQAIDLLVRKVIPDRGSALQSLLRVVELEAEQCLAHARYRNFGLQLQAQLHAFVEETQTLCTQASADVELPYRAADDYLRWLGLILVAYAWARAARVAESAEKAIRTEKEGIAQFYFDHVLVEADYRRQMLKKARTPLPKVRSERSI
jgi:hypothetical protein